MAQVVPKEFAASLALQYVISKGWDWKQSDAERVNLESCPFCEKGGYGHFYVRCQPSNMDGLYMCMKCGKGGNLHTLKEHMGDIISGVSSGVSFNGKTEQLPDVDALHEALMADEDALDYLVNGRGFSRDIIVKTKLGLTKRYFKGIGEVRALVYPYFVGNNCIFVHYRSLPPSDKAFSSPSGHDAPLYNGTILQDGLKELVMVEGEANVIAALDHGLNGLVGVPGANFKKALWMEKLDSLGIEKVYICYDNDKVGQKAAQTLASKIGIERCYKVVLPQFTYIGDKGEVQNGKDINEWFVHGNGTKELFEQLLIEAKLFDVQGVSSAIDALQEVEDLLDAKSSMMPKYLTPWEKLNKYIGFEEGDIIDIVAPEKIGKTTFGMNLMERMVDVHNEDGVIICLEMPNIRMARKWVSHVANKPDTMQSGEAGTAILEGMKQGVKIAREKASNRTGTLYFCYPKIENIDDIYKLIKDCIRRYGVKWIMVDNLQLLCDRTLGSKNRTIHLSQISKTLAAIAKDYMVQVIRILQPHRIADGRVITTDDVDGASQIAKDCDCMMTLHRNKVGVQMVKDFASQDYVEADVSFESKMLVTVGLSRYTSGGYVTLDYDGACSTVRDYGMNGLAKLQTVVEDKSQNGVAGIGVAV